MLDSGLADYPLGTEFINYLNDMLFRWTLIYLLSAVVCLIVLYLIIRMAVRHGAIDALADAGLVKPDSPLKKRWAAAADTRATRAAVMAEEDTPFDAD